MAKRKKKALKPKSVKPPIRTSAEGVIVDDYGIYLETAIDGNAAPGTRAKAIATRLGVVNDPQLAASLQIQAMQQRMRAMISLAIVPDDATNLPPRWATITADIGEGPKTYVCAADRVAGIEQAAGVLTCLEILLGQEPTEREQDLFLFGTLAGRLLEMMHVLPAEPYALQGKRQSVGGKTGNEKAYGTDSQKEEKRKKLQAAYEVALARGVGKMAAYSSAGRACGMSERTARDHLSGKK